MKRAVLISGVTAVALTVTALGAFAHEKGGKDRRGFGPRINFEQMDANGDGLLTRAEMQAHAQARFAAADTDGDGNLSAAEMAAQAEREVSARMEKMIERRDENGDGVLSFEEMQPPAKFADRMFDRLDENEDGALSQEELEKAKFGKRGGKNGGMRGDKEASE